MWLATGIYTATNLNNMSFMNTGTFPILCGLDEDQPNNSVKDPYCAERKVLAAVAFINWVKRAS